MGLSILWGVEIMDIDLKEQKRCMKNLGICVLLQAIKDYYLKHDKDSTDFLCKKKKVRI